MIILENLTPESVEICIITFADENADPDTPPESHWRIGLCNSTNGRQRLVEVLGEYPIDLQEVMAVWGEMPLIDESEEE